MRALALVLFIACGGPTTQKAAPPAPNADAELDTAIDGFMTGHFAFRPNAAIDLGLH
jgi:hypothetical protein